MPNPPKPPFETGRACHKNPVPDLNGTGGSGLAGDIGPPQPRALP